MKVEGVKKMKKREFINKHKTSFFLDRTETERENILSDIYDRIVNARPPSGDII